MAEKILSEIRKIQLDDASFKGTKTVVEHLTYVNFFFGNNGCGKSTITQAIKNDRGITYAPDKTAADYIPLVYDEYFISRNFSSYRNMPGVFTINEVNQAVQEQIDQKHEEQTAVKKSRSVAVEDKQKKKTVALPSKRNFVKNVGIEPRLFVKSLIKRRIERESLNSLRMLSLLQHRQNRIWTNYDAFMIQLIPIRHHTTMNSQLFRIRLFSMNLKVTIFFRLLS